MDKTLPAVSRPATPEWIVGRVQTLLSHYYQPDTPKDVAEAALGDWVDQLTGYSEAQVENACQAYLRSQPRLRPTPADIRNRVSSGEPKKAEGDRGKLSFDQLQLLDQVLATARDWAQGYPKGSSMHWHGVKTLEFWGEDTEGLK